LDQPSHYNPHWHPWSSFGECRHSYSTPQALIPAQGPGLWSYNFPARSSAVAVQTTSVVDVTVGGVNVLPAKLPPFVHVTVGPEVTPTLSVAANVDVPVVPDATVRLAGLNVSVGAVVSGTGGVTVTVRSAVPELPAASLALAVQMTVVSDVTVGAVNVFPEKLPPFVQVVVGPEVTPTLSVAVSVDVPVSPETTVKVETLKETIGTVVSATGGAGGGVTLPPEDDPPPQAVTPAANKAIALT